MKSKENRKGIAINQLFDAILEFEREECVWLVKGRPLAGETFERMQLSLRRLIDARERCQSITELD